MGNVTRAKCYAAGLLLSSQASIEKPVLYVVRFTGGSPFTRLRQLSALATGLVSYDPGIAVEPAEWVTIDGDATTAVQIDGEPLGKLPLEIGLHLKDLQLIVPAV